MAVDTCDVVDAGFAGSVEALFADIIAHDSLFHLVHRLAFFARWGVLGLCLCVFSCACAFSSYLYLSHTKHNSLNI